MNTTAPSKGKIAWMILFAASCVGLLLFLWISFGGSVPLSPQGYRFTVEFPQATQLGTQADVDIAGVKVGTVTSVGLDHRTGLTKAVIQIDPRYAPRPADTRAILRTKSLLGETYVALSYGNPKGPMLKDGGRLPEGQVAATVDLDQILNTFSPKTRRAFETWMQDDGMAFTGRGQEFNTALAELDPFATNVTRVLAVLERDHRATRTLLADGGQVLSAISKNPAALQGLIKNANTVFTATAARNRDLAAAVKAFPGFLKSTRETVQQVSTFSKHAMPLVNELKPAAKPLSNALIALSKLSPALKTVLVGLGPLTSAADSGVPATETLLSSATTPPPGSLKAVFPSVTSFLGNIVPIIRYVGDYRREIAAFFANGTAATQGEWPSFTDPTKRLHYLRSSAVLNPEGLTAYASRPSSNRNNPYMVPGGYKRLPDGLKVFGSYLCTTAPAPAVPAAAAGWDDFNSPSSQIGPGKAQTEQQFLNKDLYAGEGATPSKLPKPDVNCSAQPPLASKTIPNSGLSQTFPNLQALK